MIRYQWSRRCRHRSPSKSNNDDVDDDKEPAYGPYASRRRCRPATAAASSTTISTSAVVAVPTRAP